MSETEVTTAFKPFGECQGDKATCMFKDRCPIEGNLYMKGKDKKLRVRNCKDAVSRGRSNRRNGLKGQSKAAKVAGVPKTHSLRPGNEEHWSGTLRFEFKQGAQIRAAVTAFKKTESQSEASRPVGDNRPFVAGFIPTEAQEGVIYAFRARTQQDLVDVVLAWAEQLGLRE